ncbi:unnamed protein product, partial [Cuscuta campestris]
MKNGEEDCIGNNWGKRWNASATIGEEDGNGNRMKLGKNMETGKKTGNETEVLLPDIVDLITILTTDLVSSIESAPKAHMTTTELQSFETETIDGHSNPPSITDKGRRNFHLWFDSDSLNWVLESLPRLISGFTWACVKLEVKRTLEIALDSKRRENYIRILEARKEGNRFIHIPFGVHNEGHNQFLKAILCFVERTRCLDKDKGSGVAVGDLGAKVFEAAALREKVTGLVNSSVEIPNLAEKDTFVIEQHLKDQELSSNFYSNGVGDPLSEEPQEVVKVARKCEEKFLNYEKHDLRLQLLEGKDLQQGNTSNQTNCSVEASVLDVHKQKEYFAQAESPSSYSVQYPQLPRVSLSPFAAEFLPLKPNTYAALFDHVSDLVEGSPLKDDEFDKIDDGNLVLSNNALEDIREEREGPILYTHSEGEDKVFNDNILKPLQIDYSRMFKTPFDLGREFKGRHTYSPSQIVTRSKPTVFFNDEELDNIRDRFPFTVKARFKKDTTPEEIGKSMEKGGFKGGFRITAVTRFQVIIVFNQHGDYLRMLSRRSWTVNGIQLSISKWDPSTEDKHDSPQALIWVTLKHLPFFLLDKRNLFSVVKALGNPIKLDDTTARGGYYQTARVLVEMDVTKPKISSIQALEDRNTADTKDSPGPSSNYHPSAVPLEIVPPLEAGPKSGQARDIINDKIPTSHLVKQKSIALEHTSTLDSLGLLSTYVEPETPCTPVYIHSDGEGEKIIFKSPVSSLEVLMNTKGALNLAITPLLISEIAWKPTTSFTYPLLGDTFRGVAIRVEERPLLLKCSLSPLSGHKPFKFLNMWTSHHSLEATIRNFWDNNKTYNGMQEEDAEACAQTTQTFYESHPSPDSLVAANNANAELLFLTKRESEFWQQKAGVKWIKEGDASSKFFHNLVKGKRLRLQISSIKTDEGEILDDKTEIATHAINFFSKLYKEDSVSDDSHIFNFIPKIINEEDNKLICTLPQGEEVRRAIWDLNEHSASGPDGYNGVFFKIFWHIIQQEVVRASQEFFLCLPVPKSYGATLLTLIPKEDNPKSLGDYRPISLSNFLSKINTKILSNRLRDLLPKLISPEQTGFQAGKGVDENILFAQEMIHCLDNSGGSANVAIKGFFKMERGIKQGDPLSPLLFILGSEGLSRMIKAKVAEGFLKAFNTGRTPPPSHLAYADDIIFFLNGHCRNLLKFKGLLNMFLAASGHQINLSKSHFYTGAKVNHAIKSNMERTLGMREGKLPISYLGATIGKGKMKKAHCKKVILHFDSYLNTWFSKVLNQMGRLILIKHVLSSIPLHILAVQHMPKSVMDILNKKMQNFFWGYRDGKPKYHWKNWRSMCYPTIEGGLGIRHLEDIEAAYSTKLWWKLRNNGGIWGDYMRSKYCIQSFSERATDSVTWKRVSRIHNWAYQHVDISEGSEAWEGEEFSTKAAYNAWRDSKPISISCKMIWDKTQIPKIKFFLWKTFNNLLPFPNNMSRFNMAIPSRCNFCKQGTQDSNHTLLQCPYSLKIWKFFSTLFQGPPINGNSTIQEVCMNWWLVTYRTNMREKLTANLPGFIVWGLWKAYNAETYEGEAFKESKIIFNIMTTIQQWCWAHRGKKWMIIDEDMRTIAHLRPISAEANSPSSLFSVPWIIADFAPMNLPVPVHFVRYDAWNHLAFCLTLLVNTIAPPPERQVEEVAAGRELKGMRHSSEPDYYYEDYLMSIVRRIYSRICPKPATAFLYLSSSSRDEEGERCAGRENVPGMSRIHSTLQKLVLGGEEKVPDAYKFIGIDLSGMHCAILLIDKRVVSSVIFRVVGTDLAEVPLAATSAQAEGQ